MKSESIILKKDHENVFFKYIDTDIIKKYYNCDERKIIFRIAMKLKFPIKFFLGNWYKDLEKYKKVICFDNGFNERILKSIKKKNPNIKVILWYWNPVLEKSKRFLKNEYIDEVWSFDKKDVEKYNLLYNTQFYSKNVKLDKKKKNKYDVIFVGTAKTRKKDIEDLEEELSNKKIKTMFKIIEKKSEYISYDKYLDMLSESKAILDFTDIGQTGLTLRAMEAIFLEKKLITNNVDIINYDFYDNNNVFILGKDDINDINKFINTNYKKIDENIVNYYDFDMWLKRFEVEKNEF